MKTILFKTILALTMVLIALPVMGQDYLKLYFKDGHTERHFMNLVKDISVTRYDLEGNLHSDYQMQQIVMEDTTYSYYIEDIDSMTFRKVDKEKIKTDYENVTLVVNQIFQQCNSSEEMAAHLNDILNVDGVEEAYTNGSDFAVQIRDWRIINYHFHDESDYDTEDQYNEIKSLLKNISHSRKILDVPTPLKIAICHQMGASTNWDEAKEKMKELQSECNAQVFDVHFIPNEKTGEDFDFDFWENNLSNFDLVLINTHGGKIDENRLHMMCTTTPCVAEENLIIKYDFNEVGIEVCEGGVDELHGKDNVTVAYWCITENFIKNRSKSFHNPAIIFSTACHSLEGFSEDEEIPSKNIGYSIYRKGNDSFAQALIEKGAGAYVGYNNEVYNGYKTGIRYLRNVLNGLSEEESYDHLTILDKKQSSRVQAELIDILSPSISGDFFIKKNETLITTDAQALQDYLKYGKVILMGLSTILNRNMTYVKYGFLYGDSRHLDPLKDQVIATDIYDVDTESGNVLFTLDILNPTPGQKRYYQAFTYDGRYFNLGEIRDFTLPEIAVLSLETNIVELTSGETKTVTITSGSGNYTVESNDPNVAQADEKDGLVTIIGRRPSNEPAIITVTDNVSKQTATITVTVMSATDYSTGEAIDLGLPSGTLWASCNIGASSEVEPGSFFAWGETEAKQTFYRSNYQYYDSSTDTYKSLGYNISGTQYDAAHIIWGGTWRMPTMADFKELRDNCQTKWTTYKGVICKQYTGPNGKSIYLPAAGYYSGDVLKEKDETGNYWSADLYPEDEKSAYLIVTENSSQNTTYYGGRSLGATIRPVQKTSIPEEDRITQVVPEEYLDVLDDHINIYKGNNPPNIEGEYLVEPCTMLYDSDGDFNVGHEFAPLQIKICNQDILNNTVDYEEKQANSESNGIGSFISGDGENFSVFFNTEGVSHFSEYDVHTKTAMIVSGTKTADGISNLTYAFIITSKSDDSQNIIMNVGDYRVIHDGDGLAENYPWNTPESSKKRRVNESETLLPHNTNDSYATRNRATEKNNAVRVIRKE